MRGDGVRILGIAGSPRRGGNSDELLTACLDGARESGAEVVRLVAADAGIAPCTGCGSCSSTGECTVRDGMTDVYRLLDAADAIVVATPVYFATVPAVLKALYDRCQPYWARRYVLHQERPPRRPGALLIAAGGGDPYGHECAVTTTRSVFAVLSLDYVAELVVEADAPTDARRRPEALERAGTVGSDLVTDVLRRRGTGS